GELVGFDHVVGMGDLLFDVEQADLTRDIALFPHGQGFFDPTALGPEKHQLDIPGVVVGEYPVGNMRLAARGRLVTVDVKAEGDDLVEIGLGNADLAATVDRAGGHVHENVEDNVF